MSGTSSKTAFLKTNRVVRSIAAHPLMAAALIVALCFAAKIDTDRTTALLEQTIWSISAIDAVNCTIGARGQGLIIVPLVTCALMSLGSGENDSASRIVAHGSRGRYLISRYADAAAATCLSSTTCFLIWTCMTLPKHNATFNWNDANAFFFGQTHTIASTDEAYAWMLCFLCLFFCSLIVSPYFVAVEAVLKSKSLATMSVVSLCCVAYVSPAVNACIGLLPDPYILASDEAALGSSFLFTSCIALQIAATMCIKKKDFMHAAHDDLR